MENRRQKKILVILTIFFISVINVNAQLDTRTQNQIKAKFLSAQELYDTKDYTGSLEKVNEIEALTGGQLLAAAQNLKVKSLVGQGNYIKAKEELYTLEGLNLSSDIIKEISSYSEKIRAANTALKQNIQEQIGKAKFLGNSEYGSLEMDGKTGLIDKKGNVIIPFEYNTLIYFPRIDLVFARLENFKVGMIDLSNKIVIPTIYEELWPDDEDGTAVVKLNGRWGAINQENEIIIPFKYEEMNFFSNGVASVQENQMWGFINKQGKVIIPIIYESAFYFGNNGLANVKSSNKWGFINKANEVIVPFKYDDLLSFSKNGLARAKKDGSYGFINVKDEVVIPFIYEGAKHFGNNEITEVKLNGKWLKINSKGKQLE